MVVIESETCLSIVRYGAVLATDAVVILTVVRRFLAQFVCSTLDLSALELCARLAELDLVSLLIILQAVEVAIR